MDIRSSLDGLKSLLGTTAASPAAPQTQGTTATSESALDADSATLSSAGSEVSQTATDSGVRTDKVANIQAEMATGSYGVPASAVATKVVDSMLNSH
jgi:flagellar biosynthesis anti-sigma factor FlgM